MARKWTIERAAVEQVVLFPTKEIYEEYIESLDEKGFPYQICSKTFCNDGSMRVVMRKKYNNNPFLPEEER